MIFAEGMENSLISIAWKESLFLFQLRQGLNLFTTKILIVILHLLYFIETPLNRAFSVIIILHAICHKFPIILVLIIKSWTQI